MRKSYINILTFAIIAVFGSMLPEKVSAQDTPESVEAQTIRNERKLIREGNKLYAKKNYAEAEVKYRQAIAENADSEIGLYNLALALAQQAGPDDNIENPASTTHQADSIFKNLVSISKNQPLLSRAFYNLGNIAFNSQQYEQSIEMYKNTLRINPNDDEARDNLRLAQKMLQNQDQNQDQDDKQDQKQQQEEQQQDQQQDQQDQQQDQQNQNQNQEEKKDDQQQQQQQQSATPDNSEQILNAVQNNERTTQQKVNAQKAKEQEQQRVRIKNQW